MDRLRGRIKRIVENGSISLDEKQKLEHLLRTKKWNPYCFRHSAIDHDANYLPEYALKKKVRWVMGSKQTARYIKRKMGDELRNKILEHNGIRLPRENILQPAVRTCGRCNYVNRFESKYCERVGCNYPLTQMALDEMKKHEESRMTSVIDERLRDKDSEIQILRVQMTKMQGDFKRYDAQIGEFADHMKSYIEEQKTERKEQEEFRERERKRMEDTLDKVLPGWRKPYLRECSKQDLRKIKQIQEGLKSMKNPDVWIESVDGVP
jgi:hypothetical protein